MKKLLTGTLAASALISSSALAANMQNATLIENLDEYANERVNVSGVVSWVEDRNEFTLADNTGDIEVNLATNRTDIDEGDFVTVSGVVNTFMIDELDNASVDIIDDDYANWSDTYASMYNVDYDLDGFDETFYRTVDWDNDMYDDYWVIEN